MRKSKKLRDFFQLGFVRLLSYMVIPIIIAAVACTLGYFYLSNDRINSLKENFQDNMSIFSNESEAEIQNIITRVTEFASNNDFEACLTFKDASDYNIIGSMNNTKRLMSNFLDTTELVYSISLLNRRADTVISDSGRYDLDTFFTDVYSYTDYDLSYWIGYSEPISTVNILPPTDCFVSGEKKSLIPIVFSSVGSIQSTSVVIVNIDVESIIGQISDFKLSSNSITFLINKYNNTYYGKPVGSNNDVVIGILDEIAEKHSSNRISSFDFKSGNKKYYVISVSPKKSIWSYNYVTAIPYSDIYRTLYGNLILIIFLCIVMVSICIAATYFIARKLYSSLANVIEIMEPSKDTSEYGKRDIFGYLNESVTKIVSQNTDLTRNMETVLPLYQQKIITRLLNDDINYADFGEEFSKIKFAYDNFISVAVKFNFSFKFYSDFNAYKIKNEIVHLFESVISGKYNTIVIPSSDDTWYAILNVDIDASKSDIEALLDDTVAYFHTDKDYVDIVYGVGEIYQGLTGLKRTHNDAIDALLQKEQERKIVIPTKAAYSSHTSAINDETKLTNYLIAGYFNEARNFIRSTVSHITDTQVSAHTQVYVSIFTAIFKVLSLRGIEFLSENKNTAELISETLKKPKCEIDGYVNTLIDMLEDNMQVYNSKLNVSEVITYIEGHYTEDLYLDRLAERFDTTPKYLSRRIKQYINIGFKDYLLKLRIDNAKKLLKETDMQITDIALSCGIENRSTFIKAFKKICGITPSEYRNTYKN